MLRYTYLVHQSANLVIAENRQLQSRVLENCKQSRHVSGNIGQKLGPFGWARERRQWNIIRRDVPTLQLPHTMIGLLYLTLLKYFTIFTYRSTCLPYILFFSCFAKAQCSSPEKSRSIRQTGSAWHQKAPLCWTQSTDSVVSLFLPPSKRKCFNFVGLYLLTRKLWINVRVTVEQTL